MWLKCKPSQPEPPPCYMELSLIVILSLSYATYSSLFRRGLKRSEYFQGASIRLVRLLVTIGSIIETPRAACCSLLIGEMRLATVIFGCFRDSVNVWSPGPSSRNRCPMKVSWPMSRYTYSSAYCNLLFLYTPFFSRYLAFPSTPSISH